MNTVNRDQSRNDTEDEKTAFEKFEEKVKLSIFSVLYVLLSDDEEGDSGSKWQFFLMIITDYIQLFDFIFTPMMDYPWKLEGFAPFQDFLDSLTVGVWYSNLDTTTYLVILYIMYTIVFLAVLDIVYVSYSFSQKKFTFIWPLKALRNLVSLFVSALFVPFLESFATVMECDPGEEDPENLYLSIHPEMMCWHGFHILHAAFSGVCSIIFITIALVSALCYYEGRNITTDISAKVNSRADVFYVVIKIVACFVYAFLKDPSNQWIVINLVFVLAFINVVNYRARPFYNDTMNVYFMILSTVFFWGICVLFLQKTLEFTEYDAGVQLYFLGLPIVVIVILFEKDYRPNMLLKSLNQFQKGEEAADQIRYFLHLIRTKDKDRKSHIILKGYIHHHEDSCTYPDCQLKIIKMNDSIKVKSAVQDQRIKAQDYQLLVNHAKNMYRTAILKFPDCSFLKIQYALFLMEWLKSKQESISMLDQAMISNPPFDEQFVIFRYKKIFEEFGLNNPNGGEVDIVAQYAYESTLRQLYEQIFKTAKLYQQFWKVLVDDNNITKLNECGHKINQSIVTVEQHWAYLQKIHPNDPKAIKVYSQFLIQILNDKEAGRELIDIAKDAQNNQNFFDQKNSYGMGNDGSSIVQQSTPAIRISGDIDTLGQILYVNMSACQLFGYSQDDMRKKPSVNKLMPEIFAKHHDQILQLALQKGANNISRQDQLVFAKHKSGFLFPVRVQFKMIESADGIINFMAIFTLDKKQINTNTAFVILNNEKKIQGLSSGCLNILNLDYGHSMKLINMSPSFHLLCPTDLWDQQNMNNQFQPSYQKAEDKHLEWYPQGHFQHISKKEEKIQNIFKMSLQKQSSSLVNTPVSRRKRKLIIKYTMHPIKMGVIGEIGWQIKLDIRNDQMHYPYNYAKFINQSQSFKIQPEKPANLQQKVKQPLFQFKFDYFSGKFIRDMRETLTIENGQKIADLNMLLRKQSTIKKSQLSQPKIYEQINSGLKTSLMDEQIKDIEAQDKLDQEQKEAQRLQLQKQQQLSILELKKKWGEGIVTYRLSDGKFLNKESEEQLLKLQMQAATHKTKDDDESEKKSKDGGLFRTDIKSRRALHSALFKRIVPPEIISLKRVINVAVIMFIILATVDFVLRISEIQRIAYDSRTLIFINEKKQKVYQNYTTALNFTEFLIDDIQTALDNLYELHNQIQLSTISVSDEQSQLLEKKSVNLYFLEKKGMSIKTLKFSLPEAVLQIASAIFSIQHMSVSNFYDGQQDLFFVLYNSFNDFLEALRLSSMYYTQDQAARIQSKSQFLLIIFLSALAIMVLSMVLVFPVINKVNQAKSKILLLFIDIPKSQVVTLADKCEKYMLNFDDDTEQAGEDQENQSSASAMMNLYLSESEKTPGGSGSGTSSSKPSRRKRHQTKVSNFKFFVQFGSAAVIAAIYFVVMFVISLNFIQNIEISSSEINLLAQAESYYSFAQNVQREMIYDPENPIIGELSFDVASQSLEQLYTVNQLIMEDVQLHADVLSDDYINAFNYVYQNSLCEEPSIRHDLIPFACESILQGTPAHGLQLVISHYFETLKESLKQYVLYKESGKNVLELLDQQVFLELYIMQFRYIQGSYRNLVGVLKDTTNHKFIQMIDTRIVGFIVFIMSLVIVYLAVWLPYVSNLNKEIWRTKSMLRIIPIEVMQQMNGFVDFMKSQHLLNENK